MGGKTTDQRILVLAAGFGILMAALTGRLFFLQIIEHPRLSQLATRQQERTIELQTPRGRIFDRAGRPLAMNLECQSFFAVPDEVVDPARTARALAPLTSWPAAALEKRLRKNKDFVWIRRKTGEPAAAAIRKLGLPGIHHLTETRRVYPEGRLACHVLGFVGLDNQGLDGIELQYEGAIRGTPGWMRIARDARGRVVESASRLVREPEPGQDVYLTLDSVIQHVAERELARAVEKYRARAGSIVVLDPANGEVLALANAPDFDPNAFGRFTAEARRNRAVRDLYEPGSTFKLVTAAAALETGTASESTPVDCEMGKCRFAGRIVKDHIPRGRISFADVFGYSSNIGTVKVGQKLGADRLVSYARAFGFGKPTGIELPGEAVGLLKSPERWTPATMASVPYGQEVAVTTLQSAVAYAAAANGGWLPKPTLIRELRQADGGVSRPERLEVRRQVVSQATAGRLRGLLQNAVAAGTGIEAQVPNFLVAGKTGTAQIPLSGGRGYDPVNCVASFIGFLPADSPRVLVAVVIDSPQGVQWGGVVAGPVFREIGRNLVSYLAIPPSGAAASAVASASVPPAEAPLASPASAPAAPVAVPDLTGQAASSAPAQLKALGLRVVCLGRGSRVAGQRPSAGTAVASGSPVTVYLADAAPSPTAPPSPAAERVAVPNLAGLSLRTALQTLAAYGLRARVTGSGVVRAQSPLPLVQARLGSVCTLECRDPELWP